MANIPEARYHKLASEYSKLRAQASVLRKAVLDEQAKNCTTRDQLRQRESALRRSEQEVDSLGFRNIQLGHRVAALQDELAKIEGRKGDKEQRKINKELDPLYKSENGTENEHQTVILEELQKKIMENAQLMSLNDDKERELKFHSDRISSLEQVIEKRVTEQGELEKRLRRDIDALQSRNSELETKLVEAASMIGSEDALSASGSDNAPLYPSHYNHIHATHVSYTHSNDFERIALLEQEVSHWRTKYELAKINENTSSNNKDMLSLQQQQPTDDCCCTTAAAGLTVVPSYSESKSAQRTSKQLKDATTIQMTKEQLLHKNFSKKFEDLLKAKCVAESRVTSYELECQHLQSCLEDVIEEVKAKDEHVQSMNRALQMLEEDLGTTRVNYEEQISVLTEQVISLSEQLAACK